jgi:amino acid adenylation domain-containing protein
MTTTQDLLATRLAERLAKAKAYRRGSGPAVARRPPGVTPLSAAQRRLWFLNQWAPDSPAYSIPVAWRVHGPLDLDRFRAALRVLVERHEILRTRYADSDGELTAIVDHPADLPLPVVSGTDLNLRDGRADSGEVRSWLVAFARQPFDLSSSWPIRAAAARIAQDDHIVVMCLHHIAADGWSIGLIAADLAAAYEGRAVPEPVQYADLTFRDASAGPDQRLPAEIEYWRQRLMDAPGPTMLPTDHSRPAQLGDAGAMHRFQVDAATSAGVRALAGACGATIVHVLYAAFAALVSRYGCGDDVMAGTAVAGRGDPAAAKVVGCFINTLVLRTRVTPEGTARALVASVRADMLNDLEHAQLSYDRLVGELPRHAGSAGLFNLMFVATNVPRESLTLATLGVEEVSVDPGATKLDLSFAVDASAVSAMQGEITYSTELFDTDTIERFGCHYQRLLAAMAANPDVPIARLPLLTDAEVTIGAAAPAEAGHAGSVLDDFDGWVRAAGHRVAVTADDGALTYRELDAAATDLALRLRAAGASRDTVVAVPAHRSTAFVVGMIGVLKSGAAYLPVDPAGPAARVAALLRAAGATRWIAVDGAGPGVEGIETFDTSPKAPPQDVTPLPAADPTAIAYTIFTSGSTGAPKGVAVEHRHLAAYMRSFARRLDLPGGSRFAVASTLTADLGHTMVFGALTSGGTLRIISAAVSTDAEAFAADMRAEPADCLKLVPSHCAALLEAAGSGGAGVLPGRCLILAGEAASWDLADRIRTMRPGLRIINSYGPTETTVAVLTYEIPDGGTRPATIPIGRPLDHVAARIVDAHGAMVPMGVPGELLIGGGSVARGYLGRPEETASRFADVDGLGRAYRTGDRARWRTDGTVEFLGRVDRQVKIRGYRVEPGEVEHALRTHQHVADATVVADDGRLVAYVVTTEDRLADIGAFLRARLPAAMVPSAYIRLDALPLTPNGKVDVAALPAVERPRPTGRAVTSATGRLVARVFAEVLGCPEPAADDDFFALGGHSLLATQVVSRLRRLVDVPVALPLLFAHPTAGALADVLNQASADRVAMSGDSGVSAGVDHITGRGVANRPIRAAGLVHTGDATPVASDAQRRLWFLDQAVPGNPAYNLPYALEFTGALEVDALRVALSAVVARHDALRATFATVGGEPVPVVADQIEFEMPVVDLRAGVRHDGDMAAPPARTSGDPGGAAASGNARLIDRETTIRSEIDREFRVGFDLAHGPLIRARLLRTDNHVHILLLTCHHIVFDGWSLAVLCDDLVAAYRGEQLTKPPWTYADYARWQRSAVHDASSAYWRAALAGAPARLDLPVDRPRPMVPSYRGGAVPVHLDHDLMARVTAFAHRERATPFMVLLAAYQVVLALYAGVEDIVVGTPVAGRDHPDLEGLVGFFVNMVALRARPVADMPFREYLAGVRDAAIGAFAHADLPFERLVADLRAPRDPSRAPVFSTMISLRNTRPASFELPGLTMRELYGPTGVAKYDLSLVFAADGDSSDLRGALEYASDLFDEETANRIARSLCTVLAAALAQPATAIGDLPLLDDIERHRQLVEWNDTAPRAAEGPMAISDRVTAHASARPAAVALDDGTVTLTYAELDAYANRLARRLRDLGVGPGVTVAICATRSARIVAAMLGVWRAGGAYVPLDPAYPTARLEFIAADCGATVLIADASAPVTFDGARIDIGDPIAEQDCGPLGPAWDRFDLAYLIYTSGSTGQPKGVRVTRANIDNFVASMLTRPGLAANAVWVGVASFSFDMSELDIWLPLSAGARFVLAGREQALDPYALAALARQVAATHLQATPTTWRLLADADLTGLGGVTAMCGGEALPADLATRLSSSLAAVWNLYGPTETTVYSAIREITCGDVTCGRPIANTRLYVLSDRRHPVPVGVVGELFIGGAGVASGYHARPDLTAERFLPDPFAGGDARMYRTGDLAIWRPDGEISVLGRTDGQVKMSGYRIELGEIAANLVQHAQVAQAVVDLRADPSGQPCLIAYIVGAADPGQQRAWLAERVPAYLIPKAFVTLESLPTTPNGKIDRAALPDPVPSAPTGPPPPRTPTQQRVADIYAQVLGLDAAAIGTDDDFFAIGGESMRAVRTVREIDPRLSVLDLFKHPTVRGLAGFLDRGTASHARLLHRLTPARPAGTATVALVCAPFGGGGAIAYADLAAAAPPDWDVYAIQPPGRDPAHPGEPLAPLDEVAAGAVEAILAQVAGPILIYGHCVGAALAVEVTRRLEAAGRDVLGTGIGAAFPTSRLPGVFDSIARLAPGRRQSDRAVSDSLRQLGGIGEELPTEHRNQLAKAVRHDSRQGELAYTRRLSAGHGPSRAPLVVIVGGDDLATEFHAERGNEWRAFGSDVDTAVIDGAGHFFQRSSTAPALMAILCGQVRRWRDGAPPLRPPVTPPPARLRTFGLVTAGQLVSLIGTGLTTFALGVWTYQRTGSVTAFAAIAAFGIIPAILTAPLAGAAADRYDRRTIMIGCDVTGLAASSALAWLLLTGHLALWHLYVMVAVASAASTFRQPAYLAAVAQLTPKRFLGHANGIVGLGTATGTMVSQLAGGVLIVAVRLTGVIWLDVASYAVALATLAAVRFPDLAFVRRDGPLIREITAGWRFLAQRRGLLALCMFFAIANALGSIVIVLVTPLVLAIGSPPTLGIVLAAQGAGLLVGSGVMAFWGGTRRRAAGMIGFVALFAVSAVVIGLRPNLVFPALGMFGIGVSASMITAHWLALVQLKVGDDLLGRILSTALMLARTIMPIGYLVSGPLADRFAEPAMRRSSWLSHLFGPVIGTGPGRGMAVIVIVTGAVALLWTAIGYGYRPMRDVDVTLPDAAAGQPPSPPSARPAKDRHAVAPERARCFSAINR